MERARLERENDKMSSGEGGDDGPVENRACEFVANRVGVYSSEGSGRGPAIVEEAEEIYGMESLAEWEEEEDIVWYAAASIEYEGGNILGSEVEDGVDGLEGGE